MSHKTPQTWAKGQVVKVGFLHLRIISDRIPTPGNHMPDEWALESMDGTRFYRFTPHGGCFSCKTREEALKGAANY